LPSPVPEPVPDPVGFLRRLSEARTGEDSAKATLLDKYRRYLLLVASEEVPSSVRPKVAPSDVVQQSIIDATRVFEEFRGTTEAELLAWLRRIVRHDALDATRRFRTTKSRDIRREEALTADIDPADPHSSPTMNLQEDEVWQTLELTLQALPETDREIICLRNFDQLPFQEIAERLGKSIGAAKKQWARAITRLNRNLGNTSESSSEKTDDVA
jgi:RNA polymerase sigma-70 factor (ECF subfamily)